MTTKRKGILVTIVILILLLVAGIMIYRVNKKIPQVIYKDIKKGDSAILESDVRMKVKSARLYTKQEANKKYGDDFITMLGPDAKVEYKTLEVNLEMENETDKDQYVILTDIYVENGVISTGIASEICNSLWNYEDNTEMMIPAHEKKNIAIGYLLFPSLFPKNEWSNLDLSKLFLADQWYPIKNKWHLK